MRTKILIFLTVALLSSCMTQKKRLKISKEFMNDNPIELAKLCAVHFPVTDKFIKGDSVVSILEHTRIDTVTIVVDGKEIPVPCPECKQKIKTVKVTDTVIRQDNASIAVLLDQINALSVREAVLKSEKEGLGANIKKLKKVRNNLIAGVIVTGLIFLTMIYLQFKR